jgi:hypothetical protein
MAKLTVKLDPTAANKKLYKEALKAQSSAGEISYNDRKYPVIFAGKIGGDMTLVLLDSKK